DVNSYDVCDTTDQACLNSSIAVEYHLNSGAPTKLFRNGLRLIDLNGDGLADEIAARDSEVFATYLNDGLDFEAAPGWESPAAFDKRTSDHSIDQGIRFADVNGDGRPDILLAKVGSGRQAWLNTGVPGALWDARRPDGDWSVPPGTEFLAD